MKLLVTGTDGYIGVLLAAELAKRGHDVTGFDTGFYLDGLLYDGVQTPSRHLRKDIRHVARDNFAGYDAVVHLAELSNDPLCQHNPELTFEINHRGTVALARECKKAGVTRFVYASSCSVYGVATEENVTEESATNPQTAYAKCKALVERDVAAMADDDFSPTFLRNATAFGASPRMRFDIVLNNLAGLAWTTKEIKMVSDGTPWRPLVHVLDICDAIACVLVAPRQAVHNQAFNVGDNAQNYRVREIAEVVAEVFPGCRLSFGANTGDNRSYRVNFDKIHSRLPGFRCQRDARVGARELRALFERIHLTREMFEFRAFTRLRQLEHLLRTGLVDDHLFWRQGQ
jgi:nucleoside-diphosphate-sugar epimerase